MLSKRSSAFRRLALVLFALMGAAAASCAEGGSIDTNRGSGDSDEGGGGPGSSSSSGSPQGAGGGAGVGGSGSGGEMCAPVESCDGVDNDCDGDVDEGCDCQPGATQTCYTGMPSTTKGVGACKAGTQTCGADGKWGPCQGDVVPADEKCNAIDDDCDGEIDEDLGVQTCGVGACATMVPACNGGVVPPCVPLDPTQEKCDGIDNNCNQLVDESYPEKDMACMTGNQGVCAAGKYSCMSGMLVCVQTMISSAEVCDGLDNNCNGVVDDVPGTGGACSTGLPGVCSEGVFACSNGAIDCVPSVQPAAETCDGKDNDCDGQTDEGIPPSGNCQTGMPGACAAGNFTCVGGSLVCTPSALGSPEQCNGADDNCDGQADEGNPGGGMACSVAGKQGPCASGTTACSGGSIVCNQTVQPVAEVCGNGVDDDCNGAVDNGCSGSCAHDKCATGGPLVSNCDPCVAIVCAFMPSCCQTSWTAFCVASVNFCGQSCP